MTGPSTGLHDMLTRPKALLAMFCALNALIYVERGAFSSNGVNAGGFMAEFQLTLVQDGLLPTAFMVGLMASSPVFAEAAKHGRPFRLIAFGLSVWAASLLIGAFSIGFYTLLIARMLVGVGEASFVALAAPFIDDVAPPEAKSRWLATFFLCMPAGFALGFLFGGIAAPILGWRLTFLVEAAAGLPFIFTFFRAPPISLRGTHAAADNPDTSHPVGIKARLAETGRDVVDLLRRPVFTLMTLGMSCYASVLSTLAFYGPQAAVQLFGASPRSVDLAFGGITVATGVGGTLAGGALLDAWGSTLSHGAALSILGTAGGAAALVSGFLGAPSFPVLCAFMALGELALFATTAPSNAVCMWTVPPGLRPLAMSLMICVMHLLGDVPAPPLLGALQSAVNDWRVSMAVLASWLGVGALIYAGALIACRTAIDFRGMEDVGDDEGSESVGLSEVELGNKTGGAVMMGPNVSIGDGVEVGGAVLLSAPLSPPRRNSTNL